MTWTIGWFVDKSNIKKLRNKEKLNRINKISSYEKFGWKQRMIWRSMLRLYDYDTELKSHNYRITF